MEIVETSPKQRPTLLTVLCILTFIGSGVNVFSNLMGMVMSPIKSFLGPEFFEMALQDIPEEPVKKFVEQAFEMAQLAIDHIFEISLANFILYAASLTGAILMFQLKKLGFYIYASAQVLLLFVAPAFIGFNLFTNIGILFGSFFAILFIALYAVNLKKMN
ncbi:hypothetical protein L3049_07570 [Labilibaculum sp. DW002]|uniref:DUF4386 domain-containing protein n=1 Tax=Paralabilibaculum antarcticum TaxID=2912572 RepID=A0ABT5VR13_9BACT|nr:hypothetical protein [Labilibaculum sp. DW002]MDE5417864.1 hypothetical protein [Labilibaculum sp. DW002]